MRYRFRTLLVVISIFAIWFGSKANQAVQQKRAVARVVAAGCYVRYRHEQDSWPSHFFNNLMPGSQSMANVATDNVEELHGPPWARKIFGDEYFQDVAGVAFYRHTGVDSVVDSICCFGELEALYIASSDLSDRGVRELSRLRKLKRLDISRTDISGESLAVLSRMKHLEILAMETMQNLTEDGLSNLNGLPKLSVLSLVDAELNQENASDLAKLPSLTTLILTYSHLTDDGLMHLSGHPKLVYLDVCGTFVTEEGVREFMDANPKCKVIHDF